MIFIETPEKFDAKTDLLVTLQGDTAYYHKVRLQNLEPDRSYTYRVGDGTIWSEWLVFESYPEHAEEFQFIYLGDAQNDLNSLWSRAVRAAYQTAPESRFILHAGDLINHSKNDYEWAEWFNAGGPIFSMLPQMAIPGNHEYVKNEAGEKLGISPYWDKLFNYPDNGPEGFQDQAYFFDYQNCRIIGLDSNDGLSEQAYWLERVLAENDKKWAVVIFHHPVISGSEGRMNEGVLKQWKPILDKYKVDLVLQGHDHVYGRGNKVDSGLGLWDENSGTVYVVAVAGRKMYSVGDHPWMEKKAENLQTYQVITVGDDRINYKAYTLDRKIFDEFDILKEGQGPNLLRDKNQ